MWRLVVAILLFLLSLLVLFRAPTNFFWRMAVAVTEFPYIPILVSLIFFFFCLQAEKFRWPVLVLTFASLFIYTLPILEVYIRGKKLKEELPKVFSGESSADQLEQPFSLSSLILGIGIKESEPQVLNYKQLSNRSLTLDFYKARSGTKRPCILVIHGGSWAGGDSKQLPDLNFYLSQKDYHVAAINYRLAPTYKSPAPVEDVRSALDFLTEKADELGIDPSQFVLLGRSAGAQIALVAAYTFKDKNIKGVISFYGPADMVWGARIPSNKLVLNTDKVFRNYLGGLIDEVPGKYHEASAFDFAAKDSPPTLLIHGPNDPMVSYYHSVRLDKKLSDLAVPHYFLDLPWATHGCDYNINGPSGQITTYAAERFIHSVTHH